MYCPIMPLDGAKPALTPIELRRTMLVMLRAMFSTPDRKLFLEAKRVGDPSATSLAREK